MELCREEDDDNGDDGVAQRKAEGQHVGGTRGSQRSSTEKAKVVLAAMDRGGVARVMAEVAAAPVSGGCARSGEKRRSGFGWRLE